MKQKRGDYIMFKKITFLSAFIMILIFGKMSYSQGMAIAYYSAPFVPYDETVLYEPMPAIASAPIAAPEKDVAIGAVMQSNDHEVYYLAPKTTAVEYTYKTYEVTTDPVIRDFRYYDKVYEPKPTITSGGEVKNSVPIRDFREGYWKNKYYRDEFHNQELYHDTYKEYNIYK